MQRGTIQVQFLGHAGVLITTHKKIAVDPFEVSSRVPKVDIILITHSHYDHCSIKDIEKISKKGTIVIATPDAQSAIMKVPHIHLQPIEVGDEIEIGNIKIQAVPAYNKGKDFHKKNEGWVGYIIKVDKTIVYHAGDTDFIPEMKKLSGYGKHGNQFIALLPVSGKYVMDAVEAAQAATEIKPHLAVPIHFGAGVAGTLEDAQKFIKLCKEKEINAQILEKI